ncbi:unnamed protein product [Acanthoscelides obtectus]|uniref:Tetraspanin n=1 Tax=Acanthoscelides obtectus TaxID=200917 RepID=A0A9P0JIG7_ACAOB|nr:unnamed protein product [Acanthoscelides obtectus]CAK1624913.1 CD63 antigen [Acanthoscelides obtectus]
MLQLEEKGIDAGMKCVKYMLFVANFMFVLVGFLLISIGSTIKGVYGGFDAFLTDQHFSASNLSIAIGFIIFIVALFGCIGALKESVCFINMYALMLFLILVLELSVSIVAYSMRGDLEVTLRKTMLETMEYYPTHTYHTWRVVQYNLECCGVDGPSDWYPYGQLFSLDYKVQDNKTYYVPSSCCTNLYCSDGFLYIDGCLPVIRFVVSECAVLLGVGAMCISFIQLLGVIFAYLLAKSVRKLKTQREVAKTQRKTQLYEELAKSAAQNEKMGPVLFTPTSSEA